MKTIILSIIAAGCLALPAAGAKKKAVKQENPFLAPYTAKYGIPPFEEIKIEHYLPAQSLPSVAMLLSNVPIWRKSPYMAIRISPRALMPTLRWW